MLIALAKIPECKGSISPSRLLWTSAQLLVTCISLIYLIEEFFSWFQASLDKTRRLGGYKVLSFCFGVNQVEQERK